MITPTDKIRVAFHLIMEAFRELPSPQDAMKILGTLMDDIAPPPIPPQQTEPIVKRKSNYYRMTVEDQLKGVRAAIRSKKTPKQLIAGLRRRLAVLTEMRKAAHEKA